MELAGSVSLWARWRATAFAAAAMGAVVATSPASAQQPAVVVFAAASLQTALDEIVQDFTGETGINVSVSYAGTSTLVRQLEEGAAANVFISADIEWMDYAVEHGLADPMTRVDFLGNSLVLIAPATSTAEIDLGTDAIVDALGRDGRLAMADVEAVPAGRYGQAALTTLGQWDALSTRIVEAENVRAAMQFVALGEAPLGIVYQTDANAEPAVRVVATFPDDSHPPIVYPVALTTSSTDPNALAFEAYLFGETAGEVFVRNGFVLLLEQE